MTVAIYSGVSKSTTFIERLIKGLLNNNVNVLIFGFDNGKNIKSESIRYHTYRGKFNKIYRFCKYTILLTIFKSNEKRNLDNLIKPNTTESKYLLRLKYYPVLYYKPDIFHLQWTKGVKDWIWVQDFGMRLVVSLRGTHIAISPKSNSFWKDVYSAVFPKVSAFHAVSQSTAREAKKYNANPTKIYVVKSGFELEDFNFHPKHERNSTLQILSVGRSHFSKGYNIALDAIALLRAKNIAFHYTIIGVGDDESLIHQVAQLQLQQFVTLKKKLPITKVKEQISKSDVLLLSSIVEGIANVVLEAMALGTLVVSSDCGGMSEVVTNNETGFLVPNRDVSKFANVMADVSKLSQSEYSAITKKARFYIEANHTEKEMAEQIKQIYIHNV